MNKLKRFFNNFLIEIFVSLFFILSHLPGLGYEMFNTDVWKWKARTYDFGQGLVTLDFVKTIQKYHPGVTLMWIGTAAVKVHNLYSRILLGRPPIDNDVSTIFGLHTVQKFLLVLFISIVLGFCVYVLRKNFGKRVALVFGVLMALEPFYYALTRVFHLEGLMSTLMIASFLWFYHYLQDKKTIRLGLSALFASLAFLTKTSAFFLIPFVGLVAFLQSDSPVYFLNFLFQKEKRVSKAEKFSLKRLSWVKSFGIWLLFSILGFFLFWPAMWTVPGKALSTVYRGIFTIGMERGHIQLYFGEMVEDPGALFYPVVLGLRGSVFLFLGLFGSLFSLKFADKREKRFLLYAFLFTLFYVIQLTIPSKKLDRYILPAILSLGLIASFFFAYVIGGVEKRLRIALLTLFLTLGIFNILRLEKDYFSYFNPLMGGLETGIRVLEPKWIIGHHQVVNFLNRQPLLEEINEDEVLVAFPEKYYTQVWPWVKEMGYRAAIKDLTPEAKHATYFAYPVWEDESYQEKRFDIEYAETVYLRGVPVWNIYLRIPE